jgi:hypothetical protein
MSTSAFSKKIEAFAKRAKENPEKAVRAIGFGLLKRVVELSPVDTGRFRNNWFVQFDTHPQTTGAYAGRNEKGQFNGSGAVVQRGQEQLKSFVLGMPHIYILNHLPYSIALEYGHSKQAPEGMVRITAAEFKKIFNDVVAEINK